jgi:hypothetical protein
MKTFILSADANNFQNLVFPNESGSEIVYHFDGRPLLTSWKKWVLDILYDDDMNRKLPPSDFPSFAPHIPVFSTRAFKLLSDFLVPFGEFLPVDCNDDEYFIYNVTKIVDALDEEKSTIKRFKSSGRIMEITNYEFESILLKNVPIFKIPQTSLMDVFVTESFVEQIRKHELIGFSFIPI